MSIPSGMRRFHMPPANCNDRAGRGGRDESRPADAIAPVWQRRPPGVVEEARAAPASRAKDRLPPRSAWRVLRGMDESGVGEAYRLYAAAVWRLCVGLVGNEAEALDVTQEVFVRCLRHHRRLRPADGRRNAREPASHGSLARNDDHAGLRARRPEPSSPRRARTHFPILSSTVSMARC
jgi:hypothetical protein